MFSRNIPVVGNWYVNRTGQLIKVKLLEMIQGIPVKAMIEYLDGTTKVIDMQAWSCLELNRHISRGGNGGFPTFSWKRPCIHCPILPAHQCLGTSPLCPQTRRY